MESQSGAVTDAISITPRMKLVLILLVLINIVNFVDRQLPFILSEAIRQELNLTDTQIGLMGGLAFAVFYAFVSLPLAHLADRWSTKWTMVGCITIWSGMTAMCGLAGTFAQLIAARIGVAVGEAGCTPSAHAMISALVPERRRALAIGFFAMGAPLGIMFGLGLGGWMSDAGNWREAFILIGLPGLVLAIFVALFSPDVRLQHAVEGTLSMRVAARQLFRRRSYIYLNCAITMIGVNGYAIFAFGAPYLIRIHGFSATEAGVTLGLLNGGTGIFGALTGGIAADWLAKRDRRHVLYLVSGGCMMAAPLAICAWLASSGTEALIFLAVPTLCNIFYSGPCFSTCQALAPPRVKAAASAIPLFGQGLVGASLGPMLVGVISDYLKPAYGADALRYALCSMALIYLVVAVLLLKSAKTLREDIALQQAGL